MIKKLLTAVFILLIILGIELLLVSSRPGWNEPKEKAVETEPMQNMSLPPETISETLPAEGAAEVSKTESQETVSITEVPLFFQDDYPDVRYGTGTVADGGSSITCLAMVASYMTDHEYSPKDLARYFGGLEENNIARLETGTEKLLLSCKKADNFHKMLEGLRQGQVAIALMNGKSLFPGTQHFIVLTGYNAEDKIMVNDPLKASYKEWSLAKGFEEGFQEKDLLKGYSAAWLYDKSKMPEDPTIYFEPEPVRGEPRHENIELSPEDFNLLARLVWGEARGESMEGQQAVAEVILNRMASDQFPDTLPAVIYAENQFESVPYLEDAQPYQAQFEAIEAALYGPYILPEDVLYFATYAVNENVWGEIGGHIFCYGFDK